MQLDMQLLLLLLESLMEFQIRIPTRQGILQYACVLFSAILLQYDTMGFHFLLLEGVFWMVLFNC